MINPPKMDYNSRFNHTTSPASINDALGLYLLDEKTSSWHYEVCLQSVADSIRNGNVFSSIFCSFHSMKLGDVLCEISSLYQKRGFGQNISYQNDLCVQHIVGKYIR